MSYALECKKLSKVFRSYKKEPGVVGTLKSFVKRDYIDKCAVNQFDMTLEQGEFIGLLGPNGAGKTTLMKMLTGIIVPTSGDMKVLGEDPSQRRLPFRKRIALVMGQKSQLWWDIPGLDSFLLLQKYYEIPDRDFKERVDELSELLGVTDLLQTHIRKLSLGERMKMELMASLLHQPDIIFLDEPTIGLDIVAQNKIREFLREYQQKNNTTVILTSHYMADVQALCSRIVLILGGKKRFDGTLGEFEDMLGNEKTVTFSFSQPVDVESETWKGLDPQWNDEKTKVDLRIPELHLRKTASGILQDFPVCDFQTENMPIERVMAELLHNPDLLPEPEA